MAEATGTPDDNQRTHIPTFQTVQPVIERLARKKYGGWTESQREDLVSLVLEKFLARFGRGPLPENDNGEPQPPVAWLRAVVTSTGIDLNRQRDRADVEFTTYDPDDESVQQGIRRALGLSDSPSLVVIRGMAAGRALEALAAVSASDHDLIRWRYIEGQELSEIAARINKKPEATKKAVQRAAARLKTLVMADDDLRDDLFGQRP